MTERKVTGLRRQMGRNLAGQGRMIIINNANQTKGKKRNKVSKQKVC